MSLISANVLEYLEFEIGVFGIVVLHQGIDSVVLEASALHTFGNDNTNSDECNNSNNNNTLEIPSIPEPRRIIMKLFSLHSKFHRRKFKREVKIHKTLQRDAPSNTICALLKSKIMKLPKNLSLHIPSSGKSNRVVGIMILEKMAMDLMDYILATHFFPILSIKKLFKSICQNVNECHKIGIYHLDLKPENILLNRIGRAITDIKICDFGSSIRFRRDDQNCSSVLSQIPRKFGTLQYLAPECLKSTFEASLKTIHPESLKTTFEKIDVYSLGVILFILVGNSFPKIYSEEDCDENNNSKSVYSVVTGSNCNIYEFLSSVNRGCTPQCADLISRMLNDDPSQRPTMSQLLSDLFFTC